MRMIVVFIAAAAMLCGFSAGLIAGLIVTWALFVRKPAPPEDDGEIELDYSGGF